MNSQTFQGTRNSPDPTDAAALLLRDLIDYAGLFPPASLDMATSVANYDAYSRSEQHWILGRFIVPAARLGEFEEAFGRLPVPMPEVISSNWRLSVLLGPDPVADVARIGEFNARMARSSSERRSRVESVEVKVANAGEITRISGSVPPELEAYFEIPLSSSGECIAAVAACGRRAKIRTGGETADKFPAPERVVEFMRLCAAARVPFKATAGLHHPVRSVHRLTYEPDSPSAMMHGFLNVFLGAAFLLRGMQAALAVDVLNEESPSAFCFGADGVSWRGHRLHARDLFLARRDSSISFGSCSFTEPIDDLRSLHIL
jgi:hypothetical protein